MIEKKATALRAPQRHQMGRRNCGAVTQVVMQTLQHNAGHKSACQVASVRGFSLFARL